MTSEADPTPWLTVVGSTMIDLVAYAERVPERGETIVGDRFVQGFGGKGANQAVMASLMGAHVSMVNAVGDDGYGEQTLANFERYGVDTTYVRRGSGASGVAPIWVEADGSNRIIIVPGANNQLLPEDAVAAVHAQPRLDAVIGQFEIDQAVTLAAFCAARERGAITLLNPAPGHAIGRELAAVCDWVIPNETELAIIARANGLVADASDPAALALVAAALGSRLLVTLGKAGAALVTADGDVTSFPHRVDALDTTGAGDAFVGAFAFALAAGWEEAQACRLGCAVAADSVQRPGTQASFPDRDRCRELIASFSATGAAR